ncbi:hypothetical protein AVEN_21179-1, partial [Araneus ventricosus]
VESPDQSADTVAQGVTSECVAVQLTEQKIDRVAADVPDSQLIRKKLWKLD